MSVLKYIRFAPAEHMSEVGDRSAQLVVLSPPYLGHHSQEEKNKEREFLGKIFSECARVVSADGVVVSVNTDFKDRGMIYLRHMVVVEAAQQAGLLPKDMKMWIHTFKRDLYRKKFTFVLVFSKQQSVWSRHLTEYEIDNWLFTRPQVIGRFRDAIAPEIPRILVRNFTKENDLVVSACAGSGTVVIAALQEGRHAIGYEINPAMKSIMVQREQNFATYFSATG